MAQANMFYKGEEKKFAFKIEATGFDMDTDDFELEVTSSKDVIAVMKTGEPNEHGVWANEEGSLCVFYETDQATSEKNWFAIVDTQFFTTTGQLNIIGTAFIVDEKAFDGVRKSIDESILGTLKNK